MFEDLSISPVFTSLRHVFFFKRFQGFTWIQCQPLPLDLDVLDALDRSLPYLLDANVFRPNGDATAWLLWNHPTAPWQFGGALDSGLSQPRTDKKYVAHVARMKLLLEIPVSFLKFRWVFEYDV